MRGHLSLALLFLLLGAFLASASCGGGGSKPPRLNEPASRLQSGDSGSSANSSGNLDFPRGYQEEVAGTSKDDAQDLNQIDNGSAPTEGEQTEETGNGPKEPEAGPPSRDLPSDDASDDVPLDGTVFITLRYEWGDFLSEPEKARQFWENSATPEALQGMGFELLSEFPEIVSGLFRLAPGWTIERAKKELPEMFPDILDIEGEGTKRPARTSNSPARGV